jgi:aminopeptidase
MNMITSDFPQDLAPQLDRYASLITVHGLNVQPGQLVQVMGEVYHRPLYQRLLREMYRRGAGFVHVELADPLLQRIRIQESREQFLRSVPAFYSAKFREIVDTEAANLKVLGPEFPAYLADLAPGPVNEVRKAAYQAAKYFYNEGIERSKVHWCVVAAATPGWAARLFPNSSPHEAEARLWEEIFRICRVDTPDFLERWERHNGVLHTRAKRLSELGIRELRFEGPGTDLVVGLSDRAMFKGGSDSSPKGHSFEPNLPTEECFTTPDWRKTSGVVSATRPFLVNGTLVKGLQMTFSDGEISHFECREGGSALSAYLESDAGAKRLGEVALVGTDSPVFKSGLVFEEILFDENAACHIAVGSAYKGCLREGAGLNEAECESIGCNSSSVHTDIMISSEEVSVSAKLASGERLMLLEKGQWVGEFSLR